MELKISVFSVLTLITISIDWVQLAKAKVTINEDHNQVDGHRNRIKLNKCQNSMILQDFVEIPTSLKAPYSVNLTKKLSDLNSSDGFYNFTLVDSTSSLCDQKNNYRKVKLEIRRFSSFSLPLGQKSSFAAFKNYFTSQGYLKDDLNYFHPSSYCISNITDGEIDVQICQPKCGQNDHPCIAKCCPLGMTAYKNLHFSCIESSEWQPHFYFRNNTDQVYPFQKVIYPHFEYAGPNLNACQMEQKFQSQQIFQPDEDTHLESTDIRILVTGQILIRRSGNEPWDQLEVGSLFCVDGLYYKGSVDDLNVTDPNQVQGQVLIHCSPKTTESKDPLFKLFFVALCTASIPLIVIVIIYGLIWDLQNIHGWTAATFCLSMFFSFVFTALAYATGIFHFVHIESHACVAIGALAHFFYITSFSWMTVLNFDLWSTIRSSIAPSGRSKGRRKFLVYCCFGFGLPTIVVSIAVILETQFGLQDPRVIRPQYGQRVCHLDSSAFLYYAIIPTIILYVLNMTFALLIVKTLWDIKMGTQKFADSNSTKASKSQAKMFGKLFCLMGVSWIFEIVSWLVVRNNNNWFWAIFDLFNILQAFVLFWIFVWKIEIRVQLAQKFSFLDHWNHFIKGIFKRWDSLWGKQVTTGANSIVSGVSTTTSLKNSQNSQRPPIVSKKESKPEE